MILSSPIVFDELVGQMGPSRHILGENRPMIVIAQKIVYEYRKLIIIARLRPGLLASRSWDQTIKETSPDRGTELQKRVRQKPTAIKKRAKN